jgi:hypothetical protein
MQKYREVVQDRNGTAMAGVLVRVQTYPGAIDAVIYSDDGSTLATNPLTTGTNGEFEFYAADGQYQFVVSGTGIATRTITDITIEDLGDPSAGVFSSLTVTGTSTLSGAVTAGSSLTVGGQFLAADGTSAAPGFAYTAEPSTGWYRNSSGSMTLSAAGTPSLRVTAGTIAVSSGHIIGWTSTASAVNSPDTILTRDAANTLAQRNGTNAQVLRLYNTFTDPSNYERLAINLNTTSSTIQQQQAGTGVARSLFLRTDGLSSVTIQTNSLSRWSFNSAGHFIAADDNTYDIGASGASRPRSMYWGTQALAPDGTANNPAYSFALDPDVGFYRATSNTMVFAVAGGARISLSANLSMVSATEFGWTSSTTDPTISRDTILVRDAANTIAQRNGGNPQALRVYRSFMDAANLEFGQLGWDATTQDFEISSVGIGTQDSDPFIILKPDGHVVEQRRGTTGQAFRVYNTFTDTSNYERLDITFESNLARLFTRNAGTGSSRSMQIGTTGAGVLQLVTQTAEQVRIGADAVAVNYLYLRGAATADFPRILAQGADANVGLIFDTKGSGTHQFRTGNSGSNIQFQVTHIASAVNFVRVHGDVTGVAPTIYGDGTDTNVGLRIATRGTGNVGFFTGSNTLEQLRVAHVASAVNYLELRGSATGTGLVIAAQGTDTNVGVQYRTKGSEAHRFYTEAGSSEQFRVEHIVSAVNYVRVGGSATGNSAYLAVAGGDTNIGLLLSSKGSGSVDLLTDGTNTRQFRAAHTASAVNYLQVTGNVTTARPALSAQGSDTNIGITVSTKGTGSLAVFTNSNVQQFEVLHTASANRYITVTGSNGGNPVLNTTAGDLAITPNVVMTGDLTLSGLGADLTIGGASMPQNSQSANYTLVAADANKHILHPSTDANNRTFTIPANASVAYAIGTCVTFINDAAANTVTIAITSDTLVDTAGATGSRTLAANGVATAVKVTSTRWKISGTGLS